MVFPADFLTCATSETDSVHVHPLSHPDVTRITGNDKLEKLRSVTMHYLTIDLGGPEGSIVRFRMYLAEEAWTQRTEYIDRLLKSVRYVPLSALP